MTKDIKQKLDKYSAYLQSAYYANYMRQLVRGELLEIVEIYNEHFNVKFSENLNCGVCVLGLLKRLGKDYFEYVEPINKEENAEKRGESSKTEYEENKGRTTTKNKNNKKLSSERRS